jgi:hypothetical protein
LRWRHHASAIAHATLRVVSSIELAPTQKG